MNVLYEEAGEIKVGGVLAQAPASLQVESPHGRRTKVKAASVLLEFEQPAPARLLEEATAYAGGIETDFLWQCCGSAEFSFADLARDYAGHVPTPVESAGVLLKLHSAPMHFYRRSRGRFQAAPAETLKLALASAEKKRRQQEATEAWAQALARFECPPEIAALRDALLYAPDRNRPETKAFEQACKATGLAPAQLLERCGQLPDSHEYHLGRFLFEFFPQGTGFPEHELPAIAADLPLAEAEAISLDDIGTTEIDDAFSLRRMPDGNLRVGIHIAAPALGIRPDSPLDAIARSRLSTAYMPGVKITMLPEDVVSHFSLDAGLERPAVSLYLDVGPDGTVRGRHSKLERIRVAANLRHSECAALNEAFPRGERTGLPYEDELRQLWELATHLEARRGKPSVNAESLDYVFRVDDGRVAIEPRVRGAPLDKLVSELMIAANTTWGEWLAERDVAAIYRVQGYGKVRLSVHAEAHEGLGVSCYAWMTSPLRRYIDLLNQWQLCAGLAGTRAPYSRSSDTLLAALRAFDVTYSRYDEHQRTMEQYWCLRWVQQEQLAELEAVVMRESLVRVRGLPLVLRVPSLPSLAAGMRVRLAVDSLDLLECRLSCSFRAVVDASNGLPDALE